jgi:hypothetical protein
MDQATVNDAKNEHDVVIWIDCDGVDCVRVFARKCQGTVIADGVLAASAQGACVDLVTSLVSMHKAVTDDALKRAEDCVRAGVDYGHVAAVGDCVVGVWANAIEVVE